MSAILSRRAALASLLVPALGRLQPVPGQLLSKSEFIGALDFALDQVLADTSGKRQYPLVYSANLFFAHEAAIAAIPLETLTAMVRAFADAGVQRIDINMGNWPWAANSSDAEAAAAIAKYDAVVEQIRSAGLFLVINPQYSPTYFPFTSFDSFASTARNVYRQIAQRYQPDIFVIVHEPGTMARRMNQQVSTSRWVSFIDQVAQDLRDVSPGSRLGAGGLHTEEAQFNAFADMPVLDVMTIDVYSIGLLGAHLKTYENMVAHAHNRGKSVYIEETWRPTYFDAGAGLSVEESIAAGIGDRDFAEVDAKWIRAISQWASTLGLEAVTPFWTQTYFHYSDGEAGGLDSDYNQAVVAAVGQQSRTATFDAARTVSNENGAGQLSVNSANFQTGTLAKESIVSIFPLRDRSFASSTETAPSVPLPTNLAGVSVDLTDSAGQTRQAGMVFAGPTQVNCVLPASMAKGPATVTVRGGQGGDVEGVAVITDSSPAIYSANADGRGVAAAIAVRRPATGGPDVNQTIFDQTRAPVRVDFGGGNDRVFLLLFGTGFRNASSVRALVDGEPAPLIFAGAQGQFDGLDQMNIELNRGLQGRGQVEVRIVTDDRESNVVTVLV